MVKILPLGSIPTTLHRSVADLKLTSKLLFGTTSPHTPQALPPVPYQDCKLPSKLRFGYYFSGETLQRQTGATYGTERLLDGVVKTSPASQRAVLETVAALRALGHECVQFDIPDGNLIVTNYGTSTGLSIYHRSPCPGPFRWFKFC